jgi:hypothetical protein
MVVTAGYNTSDRIVVIGGTYRGRYGKFLSYAGGVGLMANVALDGDVDSKRIYRVNFKAADNVGVVEKVPLSERNLGNVAFATKNNNFGAAEKAITATAVISGVTVVPTVSQTVLSGASLLNGKENNFGFVENNDDDDNNQNDLLQFNFEAKDATKAVNNEATIESLSILVHKMCIQLDNQNKEIQMAKTKIAQIEYFLDRAGDRT